jgi:hypothetical protein
MAEPAEATGGRRSWRVALGVVAIIAAVILGVVGGLGYFQARSSSAPSASPAATTQDANPAAVQRESAGGAKVGTSPTPGGVASPSSQTLGVGVGAGGQADGGGGDGGGSWNPFKGIFDTLSGSPTPAASNGTKASNSTKVKPISRTPMPGDPLFQTVYVRAWTALGNNPASICYPASGKEIELAVATPNCTLIILGRNYTEPYYIKHPMEVNSTKVIMGNPFTMPALNCTKIYRCFHGKEWFGTLPPTNQSRSTADSGMILGWQ